MKNFLKNGYIAVYGDNIILKLDKFLMGGKKEIKAAVLPPFIFFLKSEYETPWVVNHELIHFRQNFELLFVGSILLSILERLYAMIFLKMSAHEAYSHSAQEQKAYLNQNNPEYLKTRKIFSVFHYVKNKKKFSMDENGIVTLSVKDVP